MQALSPKLMEYVDCDSMAYKEDLQRVHAKLDKIGEELKKERDSQPPSASWLRRNAERIVLAATLIVAILAWIQPQYSTHNERDIDNKIKIEVGDQLKDPVKQIGALSGDIKEIKGILAVYGIRTFALLPQSQLHTGLGQLKRSIDIASLENVDVPPGVFERCARKAIKDR